MYNWFFSAKNLICSEPLLKINEEFLDLNKIESVILNNIYENKKEKYENCNYPIKTKIINYIYKNNNKK